jgi:hypothetical protein
MTEILTESFCERCGTRYTFEPVESRRRSLGAIGTLGRGIRHFVTDPGSSLDEAFAVARSEKEQRSTANALEAFHRTFNFCLSCRQYTCGDCWNAVEGRCLSCAPTPEAQPTATHMDSAIDLQPMDRGPTPAPMTVEPATADAGQPPFDMEALRALARAEAEARAAAEADAAAEPEAAHVAEEAEALRLSEEAEKLRIVEEQRLAAEAEAARLAAAQAESARIAEEARAIAEADAAAARAQAERAARLAAEAESAAAADEAARAAAEAAARLAEELARAAVEEAAHAAAGEAARLAQTAEASRIEAEQEAAGAAAQAGADARAAGAGGALAFEPGRSLDDAIAEYERRRAATGTTEPDVVPAAAVEPIPTAVGHPIPASTFDGPVSWPAVAEQQWPDVAVPAASAEAPAEAQVHRAPVVPGAARPCPSCGLSLSASARFCRRCGTPQQVGENPR